MLLSTLQLFYVATCPGDTGRLGHYERAAFGPLAFIDETAGVEKLFLVKGVKSLE